MKTMRYKMGRLGNRKCTEGTRFVKFVRFVTFVKFVWLVIFVRFFNVRVFWCFEKSMSVWVVKK